MRHDNPQLFDNSGNEIAPRTLLQTVNVTSAMADVELTLPATPWNRFKIEVDDWASTQDAVEGRIRFGINGSARLGAADYAWHALGLNTTTSVVSNTNNNDNFIQIVRAATSWRFGSNNNESYSFEFTLDPGTDAGHLPKIWWTGMGLNDSAQGQGYVGSGLYKGVTSQEFGRVEFVRFTMSSDTIKRGIFRLYGTE